MNQPAGRALYLHSLNLNRNTDPKANNLRRRYDTNMRENPVEKQTTTLQAQNAELRAEIAKLKAGKSLKQPRNDDLAPIKSDNPAIYKAQRADKACTICVNVGRGEETCEECLRHDRKNWCDYFEMLQINDALSPSRTT